MEKLYLYEILNSAQVFESFADVLLGMKENFGLFQDSQEPSAIFYDLGSGFGKPSLAACLALPNYLKSCIGIEYLEGLYEKSLQL